MSDADKRYFSEATLSDVAVPRRVGPRRIGETHAHRECRTQFPPWHARTHFSSGGVPKNGEILQRGFRGR
jgi:hypothetical protein